MPLNLEGYWSHFEWFLYGRSDGANGDATLAVNDTHLEGVREGRNLRTSFRLLNQIEYAPVTSKRLREQVLEVV